MLYSGWAMVTPGSPAGAGLRHTHATLCTLGALIQWDVGKGHRDRIEGTPNVGAGTIPEERVAFSHILGPFG